MDKAQLDALLAAHGGRAQPVASLHVLRAGSLGPADHAFLRENAAALATIDLSRWLDRAAPEQRPAVLDALVDFAEREPARFEHEIARAPRFGLFDAERTELVTRLVGRAPESVIASLSPLRGKGELASRSTMGLQGRASAPLRPIPLAPGFAGTPHPKPVHLSKTGIAAGDGGLAEPAPDRADGEGFFDPGEMLADVDFGSDFLGGSQGVNGTDGHGATGMDGSASLGATMSGEPFGEGDLGDLLGGDLLGDGDSGGPGLFGGPAAGAASRTPVLDALLAELSSVSTPRARTAWKKRSLEAARDAAEDWGPRVTVLTAPMREAAAARAAVSRRGDERAALLEWLLQNGGRRPLLVELTRGLIALGDEARGVRGWLAQSWIPKLLPDKASWSRYGASVLDALAAERAYSEMDELFAAASGGAVLGPGLLGMGSASAPVSSGDLTPAVLAAMTAMLVSRARRALEAGNRKEALAAAAAMVCLGVPRRTRPALAALRRKRAARGEVQTLLSLAASHARDVGPESAPRLEDLVAAVHVLSDAMS